MVGVMSYGRDHGREHSADFTPLAAVASVATSCPPFSAFLRRYRLGQSQMTQCCSSTVALARTPRLILLVPSQMLLIFASSSLQV